MTLISNEAPYLITLWTSILKRTARLICTVKQKRNSGNKLFFDTLHQGKQNLCFSEIIHTQNKSTCQHTAN